MSGTIAHLEGMLALGEIDERNPLIQAAWAIEYLENPKSVLIESYKEGEITMQDLRSGMAGFELGKKKKKGLKRVWQKVKKPLAAAGIIGAAIATGGAVLPAAAPVIANVVGSKSRKDPVGTAEQVAYVQAASAFDPAVNAVTNAIKQVLPSDVAALANQMIKAKVAEISSIGYDRFKNLVTKAAKYTGGLDQAGEEVDYEAKEAVKASGIDVSKEAEQISVQASKEGVMPEDKGVPTTLYVIGGVAALAAVVAVVLALK